MKRRNYRSRSRLYLKIILIILFLNLIIISNFVNHESNIVDQTDLTKKSNKFRGNDPNISAQPSWTKEWLDNGNFTLPIDPWYNETDGDISDVNASLSDGYANFELLGDSGSFSTSLLEPTPNASTKWRTFQKI